MNASLLVTGPATAAVPGPPTSVTARAADQLAEVTWTAPTWSKGEWTNDLLYAVLHREWPTGS